MPAGKEHHHTQSADETKTLGREFAGRLKKGDAVGLIGELGSGKTHFTQGIAEGLGIRGYVKSPSFTIINVYKGADDLTLFHIDLYRVEKNADIEGLGLEEYICPDGVSVIEWTERAPEFLRELSFVVRFAVTGEFSRDIEIVKRD